MHNKTYLFITIVFTALLYGCGGSSDSTTRPTPESNAKLRFTNEAELLSAANQQSISGGGTARNVGAASLDDAQENFSQTNTQERGVDEADRVKYDGQTLFIATNRWENSNPLSEHSHVRLLNTDPTAATATEVASIIENEETSYSRNLYLLNDPNDETSQLVWLTSEFEFENPNSSAPSDSALTYAPYPTTEYQNVTLYDVSDTATPEENWSIHIEGSLHTSRKVGNKLYLVLRSWPHYWLFTDADDSNGSTTRTIGDLLPSYFTSDNPTPRQLVEANECLVPNTDATLDVRTASYLVEIDLETQTLNDAICLIDYIDGIYVSENNVYFGKNEYSDEYGAIATTIHKFSLRQNNVSYEASGLLQGTLGWQRPEFRMSEFNNQLRVVTTDRIDGIEHRLYTLQQNGADLNIIAELPNTNQPDPIGKPNEDIQAVRFWGDRAYVVTFLQIDPLYVINLSDPSDPFIAGEIEVPGFSTYLRPLNERYLFSIGTNENASGVKLALYDLNDETTPTLASEIIYEGWESYSDALFDFHALNFLSTTDNTTRIAIPVVTTSNTGREIGMHMIDATGLTTDNAELQHRGAMVAFPAGANEPDYSIWGGTPRARMHENTLFFILNENAWSGFWGEPQTLVGPQ